MQEANTANSKIVVENLGTPKDSYQHYVLIDTTKDGKKLDYSKVYPLWLHNGGNQAADTSVFDQSIFGALIYGNLQPAAKQKTLGYLHSAYQTDFSKTKKELKNNRKTYTYQLSIAMQGLCSGSSVLC